MNTGKHNGNGGYFRNLVIHTVKNLMNRNDYFQLINGTKSNSNMKLRLNLRASSRSKRQCKQRYNMNNEFYSTYDCTNTELRYKRSQYNKPDTKL